MTDTTTLAPCPFCGAEPTTKTRSKSPGDGGGYVSFVVCYCGGYSANAHQHGEGDTAPEAQAAAALAAPSQLGDGARYRCRKCGEQNCIEFNSARIVTLWPDGSARDPRDIASDPEGKLMHSASEPLRAVPVAPTPPGYALVPLKVPASLYPRLTGYEKPAPGDHHRDHDRQEIESRSAKAWGEIVQAASTQPSTHARNDALADEIVELLDSCECLENGQKENALAIVKRMCSAQFEHSEAQ